MSDESKPVDTKALATLQSKTALSPFSSSEQFEGAKKMAEALASTDFVPLAYKGKPGNCMIALELAQRTGSSVLAIMQSLVIVHGKISFESKYIAAAVNSCGRFAPLRYRIKDLGEKVVKGVKINDKSYQAYTTDWDGNTVEGPAVSIETAVLEGWYTRSGSKWPTMPDLMGQYRAATFFGRIHAPDVILGMSSDDELRDVTPNSAQASKRSALNDRINARKAKNAEPIVDDVAEAGESSEVVIESDEDHKPGEFA